MSHRRVKPLPRHRAPPNLTHPVGPGPGFRQLARGAAPRYRQRDHAAAAASAAGHQPHLRDHAAAGRRGAGRRGRRPHLPGRAQRLRQIDAAAHRRRADAARCRRALRPARRDDPLSAAGAGPVRVRHHAGLCRGGVRRRRPTRPPPRARICWSNSACPATEDPASLSGGEARRAALARALAPVARHPAAGRADQSSRPARHRVAGARTGRHALRHRADQPRPPAARTAVAHAPSGSTAASPGTLDAGLRRHSRRGATRCSSRRKANSTSSAARSRWRRTGCATASPPGASATSGGWPSCTRCAKRRKEHARRGRHGAAAKRRRRSCPGRLVAVAEGIAKSYGDRADRAGFLDPDHARRPGRHRRPERRRQDDVAEPADRRAGAGCRRGAARHQSGAGDAGPAPREPRPGADAWRRR